jgi:CheY-like chemotaxis protein
MKYTCIEAEDGVQAVDLVMRSLASDSNEIFDLILCDNVMPNMDGPTAAARMRELGYKGPIIGVTGNALPSDVEYFMSSGANAVLAKPLQIGTLKSFLRENFPTLLN